MKRSMKASDLDAAIRANDTLGRNGLIVTHVNGVPMIDARLVEEVVERHANAFRTLARAAEREGYLVMCDPNGSVYLEKRHEGGPQLVCGDCKKVIADDEFATEINPEGGYGRPQFLVCDACMNSGRWDHRKGPDQ